MLDLSFVVSLLHTAKKSMSIVVAKKGVISVETGCDQQFLLTNVMSMAHVANTSYA